MERLDLDLGTPYDALEAAIHLARYSVVRPLCRGRRVLDIACGEGYGSSFMMRWGASEVFGVDVAEEAIDRATAWFGESATFVLGDALETKSLLSGQKFDLIVSIETIEHIHDPELFLGVLRSMAAPNAVIVVSCPNDSWYYGGAEATNPYHLRRYSLEEFQTMAEGSLGQARQWALGGPIAGFGTASLESRREASRADGQGLMQAAVDAGTALVLPADAGRGSTPMNAAYFVGVWGPIGAELPPTMAVMPLGMDVFEGVRVSAARWLASGVFSDWTAYPTMPIERRLARLEGESQSLLSAAQVGREELASAREELASAREALEQSELRHARERDELETQRRDALEQSELRHARERDELETQRRDGLLRSEAERDALETQRRHALLRSEADRAELAVAVEGAEGLRTRMDRLRAELDEIRLPAARYRRLRSMVPAPLRRAFIHLYRALAGGR